MVERQLKTVIRKRLHAGRVIMLLGARQVGKSTLFREVVKESGEDFLILCCDEPEVRAMLADANSERLRTIVGGHSIVVIDEAQRVEGIGLTLKILAEVFPTTQLLVTGSSAIRLSDGTEETLTGRKIEYTLFPVSSGELVDTYGVLAAEQQLEDRLVFGSYPSVINGKEDVRMVLMELARSYLYKDILSMDNLRHPVLLDKLLLALALQVGSEVSYNELAQLTDSDSKTVERYIDLMEKSFIVFRIWALNRNMRNEVKRGKKVYFYDNGIRNAILQNFAPLALRQDVGALWENYVISERMRQNHYAGRYVRSYFWRTTAQQEIDYIEEADGEMRAFEMKWNPRKAPRRLPAAFTKAYGTKEIRVITRENYLQFLTT